MWIGAALVMLFCAKGNYLAFMEENSSFAIQVSTMQKSSKQITYVFFTLTRQTVFFFSSDTSKENQIISMNLDQKVHVKWTKTTKLLHVCLKICLFQQDITLATILTQKAYTVTQNTVT